MLERSPNKPDLTPGEYRDAMSHLAGMVHVVTTDGAAGRRGVTVSAAVSVSDDPATLMVCLNRNRAENRWYERNGCFAVNMLCADQIDLARAFAGEGGKSMEERFGMGAWSLLETGSPVLQRSRMALDCQVVEVQAVHTHYVLLGRVVAAGQSRKDPALLYLDRTYRTL